jgi:hypothetical protein
MKRLNVIRGQDLTFTVKLRDENDDPIDFSNVEVLQAKMIDKDDNKIFKQYIPLLGDTVLDSDLISNIAVTKDIKEGQQIAGTGIPAGATVLKTPESTTTPTATGVIQISAPATANGTAVALIVGALTILTPSQWGKCQVHLNEDETKVLGSEDLEMKVRIAGDTKYKLFTGLFNIIDRPC